MYGDFKVKQVYLGLILATKESVTFDLILSIPIGKYQAVLLSISVLWKRSLSLSTPVVNLYHPSIEWAVCSPLQDTLLIKKQSARLGAGGSPL